ncbi:MAG: DUF6798 domain-containing protein [Bryobacteraceae bacterium]|nr:DUF6798 domain-containing protein [Bryobacteraceae bacterium]
MNQERLLAAAAIAAITLLGFFYFPGHTYLHQDTQIYVPILERLRDPSLFTQDPVALRPHVTYTIYDEVTLALARLFGGSIEIALKTQQLLSRAAGVLGVVLIAVRLGLSLRLALLVAAIVHLGATVSGPAVLTVEYEPVPRGFAVPLLLLALGLIAQEHWLAAEITACVALLYHPPTAFPFLAALGIFVLVHRQWRMLWPVAAAGGLLYALALAQPGLSEKQVLFGTVDPALEALQRMRAAYNWISLWSGEWVVQYVLLFAVAVAAWWRLRRLMPEELRLFLIVMPVWSLLTMPASYLLLEQMKWSMMPQFQPARATLFLVVLAQILGGICGLRAARERRWAEAALWLIPAFAIPVHTLVLRTLPPMDNLLAWKRTALVAALVALTAAASRFEKRTALWALALFVPFVAIPLAGEVRNYPTIHNPQVDELAAWAKASTPRDAVFLFPDAARSLQPGIFRARALRSLYVDWKGGGQVNLLKQFADEWWKRWQRFVPAKFERPEFELYRQAGIDFIVLDAQRRLEGREAAFENSRFVAYAVR